jgi:hypothetical protein
MSSHLLRALGLTLAALLLAGCSEYNDLEQAEYDRSYAATKEVLTKYFTVRESDFVEGHMIAYSRIGTAFMDQQRYKIDAWIDRNEEGFFVPRIQALQQVNTAVVLAGKNSRGQQATHWTNAGLDHNLEADLTNEIMDLLAGHTSHAEPGYFMLDTQLLERQKKIDEARQLHREREQGQAP